MYPPRMCPHLIYDVVPDLRVLDGILCPNFQQKEAYSTMNFVQIFPRMGFL